MEYDLLLLQRLLQESASDSLVFRPVEYKFDGALNLEKSQILRDILGMANAWRRSDSFILVGVEKHPAGGAKILGVIEHLDQEKIIEFVNSKVQKPIAFYYQAYLFERKKIGLIHIPLQERPFFLKEDYANLKKYVIYVKRGETILEAGSEEVARIKAFARPEPKTGPRLRVEFANSNKYKPLGRQLTMKTFLIDVPEADRLPDLKAFRGVDLPDGSPDSAGSGRLNREYYRELAAHFQQIGRVSMVDFCLSNTGPVTASGVRMELHIEDPEAAIFVQEGFEILHRPERDRGLSNLKPLLQAWNAGVRVRRVQSGWWMEIEFGDIPAGKMVFSSQAVYLGARESLLLGMIANVTAENLNDPIQTSLTIDIQTQKRILDKAVICK